MHSGFVNLRTEWPMNARARNRRTIATPGLEADIDRVDEIWNDCRRRFGASGPWLFGDYSIADAMYAPVVLRFNTYGAPDLGDGTLVHGRGARGWDPAVVARRRQDGAVDDRGE